MLSSAGGSLTMVSRTSEAAATSFGDVASLAPKATSESARELVRFQTVSVWPALSRFMPMGWPIKPRPISPTLALELAADSTEASCTAVRLGMAEPPRLFRRVGWLRPVRFYSITTGDRFSRKEKGGRGSGSFGAVTQWEHRRSSGRGDCSRSGSRGPLRIACLTRALRRSGRRLTRLLALCLLVEPHNELIGDFPAKISGLAPLHQTLFQKNGAPRIGTQGPGSGQKDIAGAVMHLDPAPEQSGIARHTRPVSKPLVMGSIVRKDSPRKTCG